MQTCELPAAELRIIWRYLDAVSQALARRFDNGHAPGEENLTFLLCELLGEDTAGLHRLDYSLADAQADLAKADGGIELDISLQTHPHSKHVESRYSGADIGLVFQIDHPLIGKSEKAILLQAKRLFPSRGSFSLESTFKSFDRKQCEFLSALEDRFRVWRSIFYLWYLPTAQSFNDDDRRLIRSYESVPQAGRSPLLRRHWEVAHEQMLSGVRLEDDELHRAWRSTQPATRISHLKEVKEITEHVTPSVRTLYDRSRHHDNDWPFEPFADLLLDALQFDFIGSDSPVWLALARGEKVSVPPLSAAKTTKPSTDVPDRVPAPRHTITFAIRSSLPEADRRA